MTPSLPHCWRSGEAEGRDIDGCSGGSSGEALRLDPKANPAAAEILADPPPDSGSEVLGNINMTLLLR